MPHLIPVYQCRSYRMNNYHVCGLGEEVLQSGLLVRKDWFVLTHSYECM